MWGGAGYLIFHFLYLRGGHGCFRLSFHDLPRAVCPQREYDLLHVVEVKGSVRSSAFIAYVCLQTPSMETAAAAVVVVVV